MVSCFVADQGNHLTHTKLTQPSGINIRGDDCFFWLCELFLCSHLLLQTGDGLGRSWRLCFLVTIHAWPKCTLSNVWVCLYNPYVVDRGTIPLINTWQQIYKLKWRWQLFLHHLHCFGVLIQAGDGFYSSWSQLLLVTLVILIFIFIQ